LFFPPFEYLIYVIYRLDFDGKKKKVQGCVSDLAYLSSDLVATLASLDMNNFPHIVVLAQIKI
jgi:hypothetical protein